MQVHTELESEYTCGAASIEGTNWEEHNVRAGIGLDGMLEFLSNCGFRKDGSAEQELFGC